MAKEHQALEAKLGSIALANGIQPRHVEAALAQYKKHLRELPDDERDRLFNADEDAVHEHAAQFFQGAAETAPQPEDDGGSSSSDSSSMGGASSSMNTESAQALRKRGFSWS